MKKIMVLLFVLLLTGVNVFAAGDLTVNGTVNTGAGGVKYLNNSVQQSAWSPGAYVKVSDVKPTGTCAQTATANIWNTRHLNAIDNNDSGLATLTSNRITLTPGTYVAHIYAPLYAAGMGVARLQNVTNGSTILDGTNVYGAGSVGVLTYSIITGSFTVAANQLLEVQQYFTGGAACGGGLAMSIPGRNEVFTSVEFWKVQ